MWGRWSVRLAVASALVGAVGVVLILLYFSLVQPDDVNTEQAGFKCRNCLYSLQMSTSAEGWAGGIGRFFFHYTAGAWRWERGPSDGFTLALAPGPGNEEWAAGAHLVFHFDGALWREVKLQSDDVFFTHVSAAGPNDAWFISIVGYPLWHYHNGQWAVASLPKGITPRYVSMVSAEDGWATGVSDAGWAILHYRAGEWREELTSDGTLGGIAMTSTSDGWAVGNDAHGNGVFYHYDGTGWKLFAQLPSVELDEVTVNASGDAWALGSNPGGTIHSLLHFDGLDWVPVSLPAQADVQEISAARTGEIWILGLTPSDEAGYQRGTIWHYQAGRWQTLLVPRRPPVSEWDLPLRYAMLAYLLALLLPLALLALRASSNAPKDAIWGQWIARIWMVWAVVFALVSALLITLSIWGPDAIDSAAAQTVKLIVVEILIAFPLLAGLAAGVQDAFRQWRRLH